MKGCSLVLSLALSLLVSGEALAVCQSNTPLLKIDGRTVDYSYFKYIESTIPQWAMKKYYPGVKGKEKLLNKVLERQLILQYYEDSGFFKRPEVREQIQRFKIEALSNSYFSKHLKMPRISEAEVNNTIEKYYKGQKVTPQLRRRVKINLEAQKLSSERKRLVSSVVSKIKFISLNPKSLNDVVAVFDGRKIVYREVKPLIRGKLSPEKLKEALKTYAFYLKALDEGLDKTEQFENKFLAFKENLAVSSFEKNILSRVKVTDKEIRKYYDSHKDEFKVSSARVLILEFQSEDAAKKALKSLESGKKLDQAVPRFVLSTAREWKVLSSDKNNPVSLLVFSSSKKYNILTMPDGRTLLIIVESKNPPHQLLIGDVYYEIKNKLTAEREKELLKNKVAELKKRYSATVLPSAYQCLR